MIEVKIDDLRSGFYYYAMYKNGGKTLHHGKFEKINKPGPYKFAQFIKINNFSNIPMLNLCELYFTFYEKNVEVMAYTNVVLRKITGDPNFIYYKFPREEL